MQKFALTLVCLAVAGFSLGLAVSTAQAGEPDKAVEAKIEAGLKAYKAGQTGEAMAALQEAISAIQKSAEKGLAAFFPKAPEGWEAGKLDSNSVSAGGSGGQQSLTTLEQKFTRKKDELTVAVSLANSPQLLEAQEKMIESLKNPQILKAMNADPKHQMTLVSEGGWTGFREVTKGQSEDDKGSARITAFCGGCVLTVEVRSADEKVLDTFWKAIDLKGLAAAAPKAKKPEKTEE